MLEKTLITILAILSLAILSWISHDLYSHESEQQARYCQMVDAWQDSGGDIGWPDYNGNYSEVCK
jgi:hypothetical protein